MNLLASAFHVNQFIKFNMKCTGGKLELAFFVRQLILILGLEKELNNGFDHSLSYQKICLRISLTGFYYIYFFMNTGFYF